VDDDAGVVGEDAGEDAVDDEGVKDGLRSGAGKDGLSFAAVPVPSPSPSLGRSAESVFVDRANQLFVAAIACRTAWRPLSSTLVPDPEGSAG
jgi:hypothetical protein